MKKTVIKYDIIGAGPVGHPQEIFEKQLTIWRQNQKIDLISSDAHTISDNWFFEIIHEMELNFMPSYMKIVGSAVVKEIK